jgi:ergothioneine biosynthesis protein EgtB
MGNETVVARDVTRWGHATGARRYLQVRAESMRLAEPLTAEDCAAQSMPDASPAKWHLAHTTWFFEQFVLRPHAPGYRVFDQDFEYLFNSYYDAVGERHPRSERGLLTRPPLARIVDYRAHVDERMQRLLADGDAAAAVAELGLNHEQQHQELMLTDVKHLFSRNVLEPAYRRDPAAEAGAAYECARTGWSYHAGGMRETGADPDSGFCFDNETPRHRVWVDPYRLAHRPVTNGEFREFVRDGSYDQPLLWLSDGWSTARREGWRRPLYWSEGLDSEFTLGGRRDLDPDAPVCHVSYYEADAYARWAGARLPTEVEWELAAADQQVAGNLLGSGSLHPRPARERGTLAQLFGDVWEWTASPYVAYPGFVAAKGALGEYNGKFMCNQMVLRGGSCATPAGHVRASYRNFFPPQARWQFSGLRLAGPAES